MNPPQWNWCCIVALGALIAFWVGALAWMVLS